jgi:hypothetical protein
VPLEGPEPRRGGVVNTLLATPLIPRVCFLVQPASWVGARRRPPLPARRPRRPPPSPSSSLKMPVGLIELTRCRRQRRPAVFQRRAAAATWSSTSHASFLGG